MAELKAVHTPKSRSYEITSSWGDFTASGRVAVFMVNLKLCKRAPHEQIVNKRKSSSIGLNHLFTTDSIYYGFVSIMRVSAGGALVIDMNL